VSVLRGIRGNPKLDVRELVFQRASTAAVHDQENRPTPEQLQANYGIDQALCEPNPKMIGLFDDVVTTGAHFRAASAALKQSLPGIRIIGFFIARRVPEAADFGEFEL
jgi:predicted amidophosphoribosyltransferase